ncbi:NAD(+) diphosphatase [bacterium]|nr:NAD(+) diphosphatase [bacterium]
MPFTPNFIPPSKESEEALWFVYHQDRLLIKTGTNGYLVPRLQDLEGFKPSLIRKQFLGSLNEIPCYAAELSNDNTVSDKFALKGLRELFFGQLEEELIWIAGQANQLLDWNRSHQFCGKCGQPTEDGQDERAKVCPQCRLVNYPRVSPAVIVAVTREDQILLGTNIRFKSVYYSVLAGFVEPGENLEECVAREIKEEVGISVNNIRYFASQPWPFPNSLMVAFLADYAGGEIKIDPTEIKEAGWFTADNLPSIPPRITIARQLIDWFVNRGK